MILDQELLIFFIYLIIFNCLNNFARKLIILIKFTSNYKRYLKFPIKELSRFCFSHNGVKGTGLGCFKHLEYSENT